MNTRVSRSMRQLIDARLLLTVYQLPSYAPEFNPVEACGRTWNGRWPTSHL
ncbi:transposase [Streptomyces sp. AcE210]|uniref:transposase n=1 Tax=Streptomyces sp. AcE210 TaxID=2292703 RepID=UPI001F0C9F5E|nr:transposase [Streptomyces sp. AcE210]